MRKKTTGARAKPNEAARAEQTVSVDKAHNDEETLNGAEATAASEIGGDVPEGDAAAGDGAQPDEVSPEGDEAVAEADVRYKQLSDQYVRLVADFDNFRRRTRTNEAAVREQAAAALIQDLLPVIDNLQLALAKTEATPDDAFASGITLIEQQLAAVLQTHGVQPIEATGQPFDPNVMEAVAQIDAQGHVQPGHVAEQLRRGYTLHGKVLRAAQVIVAQAE